MSRRTRPQADYRTRLPKRSRGTPLRVTCCAMRDGSNGAYFCHRVEAMGITEVVTAPRSPWQNAYVERVIGSIRRECLACIIATNVSPPDSSLPSF